MVPAPFTSPDDVFCLQETRITKSNGRISLLSHEIRVDNLQLREQVEVNHVSDFDQEIMHVRIWHRETWAHTVELPLEKFRVHF